MNRKITFILLITVLLVFVCQADLLSDRIAELSNETNQFKASIENAKLEMRDLDYAFLENEILNLEKDINQSKELYEAKNEDELYPLLGNITSKLNNLEPLLYESLPVETRAMWVDRANVESFFNKSDIQRHLDLMQSININVIFIDVYNNGTSIYPSKVATQLRKIQLMYDGDDLLADYIEEAHARGIEVHPLVRIFAIHNGAEYFVSDRSHWFDKTKNNSYTLANGFYWLNPAHPEVREYMIAVLKELTENYDVDGIHLDYIRSDTDFGYSQYTRDLFKELFGTDPLDITSEDMKNTFTVFITQFVNKFVERSYAELKAIKPNLIISAAVVSPISWIKLEKAQDWVNWAENRIVHFVTPMAYRTTAKEYSSVVLSDINSTSGMTYVFPGLGIYLVPDGTPVLEQLKAAQDLALTGQALYSSTSMKNIQYKVLQDGPWSKPAIPTYRDPQNAAYLMLEDLALRIEKFQKVIDLDPALTKEYVDLLSQLSGNVKSADLRKWDTRDLRAGSEEETVLLENLISQIRVLKDRVSKESSKNIPSATAKRIIRDLEHVESLLMPLYYTSQPFVYKSTTML